MSSSLNVKHHKRMQNDLQEVKKEHYQQAQQPARAEINKILVLCLGNICRSPMAEGFLKSRLPEKVIMSAGLTAMAGYPADPFSVRLMQEHGIDISSHRSQNLTDWMVEAADLILTMDTEQMNFIERAYPAFEGRIMRLGQFGGFDIPDPYCQGIDAFRESQKLIVQGINEVLEHILHPRP